MNKKIISILLMFSLVFSLVACGNSKVDKKEMQKVDINFNVKTVTNGTMEFDYPSDEWEEIESPFPNVPVMFVLANEENTSTNINIVESSDVKVSLEKYLEIIPSTYKEVDPNFNVVLTEIRTIGDIEIAYNENIIKYEELGEEAKQIQMTLYLDNKSVTITGTYSDDSEKEMILKAMTTMIQTARLI